MPTFNGSKQVFYSRAAITMMFNKNVTKYIQKSNKEQHIYIVAYTKKNHCVEETICLTVSAYTMPPKKTNEKNDKQYEKNEANG